MAIDRRVREVIEGALRLVGAIAVGETPAPEDVNTGLKVLQDLIGEWGDGGLVVPSIVAESFPMTIGQVAYDIGVIGAPDFDTPRPEQIIGASVRSSGYDYPVTIIGQRAYWAILDKSSPGRPTLLWYNPTAPLGIISLWKRPDTAENLWIRSIKPFLIPDALAEKVFDTTQIPRNYHNALKWNLALELIPEYGIATNTSIIVARAQETYNTIVSLNAARRVQPAQIEIVTGGGYDNNDLIAV